MMNDAPMHKDEPIAKSNPLVLSLNPCCDPSRKWGSSIKGYDDDDDKEEEENRASRVVIFLVVVVVVFFKSKVFVLCIFL